jgi:hypothetical protein
VSLSGDWVLRKKGSDYLPELEDQEGIPPIAKLVDSKQVFRVTQVSALFDEIHFSHDAEGPAPETVYHHLGKLNFESIATKGVVVSIIVHVDGDFKEFSVLRIGPEKHQRSLVQYKLDVSGNTCRVEVDIVLSDSSRKKLVKYLVRRVDSPTPEPIYFHSAGACSGWVHTDNHAPRTFRGVKMHIPECVDIVTPTEPSSSGRAAQAAAVMPSLAASEAQKFEPHVTRHFNGTLSHGENLTVFTVVVSNGNEESWTLWHRYREFDALKKIVEVELEGKPEALALLPPFPGKTLGRVKGKALAQRREALGAYIWCLVTNLCFNNSNLVDAVCAFLEIPEHTHIETVVPGAQNLLRQQIVRTVSAQPGEHSNQHAASEAEEAFPKHILLSKLMRGMRVIKHGQHGKPRIRLLRCNPTLTRLYWSDEDAVALPDDLKSVSLISSTRLRKATSLDAERAGYCGTAAFRRSLQPAEYSVSFTIAGPRRCVPCYAMLCYAVLCYAMLCCAMLCYAMLCYAVLCYAMLCYAVLCCAMLCYAMLCYAVLCYAVLCYAVLCYAVLCYAMLCYAVLCCAMLCYAMLYYTMLCYAVLCCAMLCYAMLCYAMLCYAMLCYAMLCCAML